MLEGNDAGSISQEETRYGCLCGKSYLHRRTLVRHKTFECGKSLKMFVCDVCGANYKRKDNLRMHYNSKHIKNFMALS